MKSKLSRMLWLVPVSAVLFVISVLVPTSVTAPANPANPRAVFLIDHGTHSSLAIETSNGEMLRYSYGDLRYYAKRDTSLASGAAALLWPTPATLGRGELQGPISVESLRSQLVVVVEQIYPLEVSGNRADALIARLDEIFIQGQGELISVPEYGLIFAPHPQSYFLSSNSSTMIGAWLRELGATVFGWSLTSSWTVTSNSDR
jgi:hypothetical protein